MKKPFFAQAMFNLFDVSTTSHRKYHASEMRKNSKYGKYIGKRVIAGCGFKSIRGKIVDVKDEYDDIFGDCTWFYIKDEDSSLIDRYAKEEICEIVPQIQETYIELE